MVRDIKVGDIVYINFNNYAVYKYKKGEVKDNMEEYKNTITGYSFPVVNIDGEDHLFLYDKDVKYVIEDSEEIPDEPSPDIIKVTNKIIPA